MEPSIAALVRDPALPDEHVVDRLLRGEIALFEIIMRRYNQRLFRVMRAILRNDAETEDALQQAYLSAYAHLNQFAGEARFATWLTRIAINEAYGRVRSAARAAEHERRGETEQMSQMQDKPPTPEDQAAAHEVTALIERACDALPEIYRVVFVLREIEGLSTAETGAAIGLSQEAVKVRLHRARAMLREQLAEPSAGQVSDAFHFAGTRCDRVVAAVLARIGPSSGR